MSENEKILSAIQETTSLILRFKEAIDETKKKYSNNPRYLALSVAQSQRQIQKMVDGIFKLLDVDIQGSLPLSFGMFGDDNPDNLVRIDSLKAYLDFLTKSMREASLSIDPTIPVGGFLIRAAKTDSLHISVEPPATTGENGFKIISQIGSAFQEIKSMQKPKGKCELSPLAQRVIKLAPRGNIHLSKVEFSGSSLSQDPFVLKSGEISTRKNRTKKDVSPLLPIIGKVVLIDGERQHAFIGGEPRIKFHFSEEQAALVFQAFMKEDSKITLLDTGHRKSLVEISFQQRQTEP
jgi:hypothetical protein